MSDEDLADKVLWLACCEMSEERYRQARETEEDETISEEDRTDRRNAEPWQWAGLIH